MSRARGPDEHPDESIPAADHFEMWLCEHGTTHIVWYGKDNKPLLRCAIDYPNCVNFATDLTDRLLGFRDKAGVIH